VRIVTCPRNGEWIVVAEWYGAEREVHRGKSIFDCIRWRAANMEVQA
jgi:hypothetical protein